MSQQQMYMYFRQHQEQIIITKSNLVNKYIYWDYYRFMLETLLIGLCMRSYLYENVGLKISHITES